MSAHDWREPPRDEPARPPPGEPVVVITGLIVGLVMMGIQLWLLTLAFDLYLSGERAATLLTALCSGLIFLGGLLMLRIVDRRGRR
jgi:hypothetical protein